MSRLKTIAAQQRQQELTDDGQSIWPKLCRRIHDGKLLPIISDTVFFEQIFDLDADGIIGVGGGESSTPGWSIAEQLADAWAARIGFPLEERHRMERVALYHRVTRSRDDRDSKTAYLNWLKRAMLFLAEDDDAIPHEKIEEQSHEVEQSSFADIAAELGYPRPQIGQSDVLTQLVQLKLPIYLTTSHFDFLERAIRRDGGNPRTQVCFWAGQPFTYVDPAHRPDEQFVPTRETPLVYHLFGLEAYPDSLVLTEDDYLDFLSAIAQDAHQTQPLLPLYLRQALTQSSLLLLGYRPNDWDFRILFRGLINNTPNGLRMYNLALQIDPKKQPWVPAPDAIIEYVKGYFEEKERQLNFSVHYGTTAEFMTQLWEAWNRWR